MSQDRKEATRGSTADAVMDELRGLHAEIDSEAAALAALHGSRLQCKRGCHGCCVDDLTVSRVEAERIRRAHQDLLEGGEPHAAGGCAFLDEDGACRIYAERPSVCRSQGLPLRFFFEDEAGEIEEGRDLCPLNEPGGPPVDQLAESDCWLIGPHEHRMGMLDVAFGEAQKPGGAEAEPLAPSADQADGDSARVFLRSLFAR
ncbi:MAG: YkgJ family cysteine cluster protein [Myxococcota bacterium]